MNGVTNHGVTDVANHVSTGTTAGISPVGRRGFLAGGAAALGLAAFSGLRAPTAQAGTPRALTAAALPTAWIPTDKFGLDISLNGESMTLAQKYKQVAAAYRGGLGGHMKFFDGGGGWAVANRSMTKMGWGHAAGEIKPVFCAKTHTDAAFNQLMTDRAKTRIIWACFWQEVNDNIRDGHISIARYRGVWRRLDALRKAHPHGHNVRLVPIMNAFVVEDQAARARAGGYDTVSLLKGLTINAVGYDLYDDSWMPARWSARWHLAPAAAAARALGTNWCIPEYGVQRSTKAAGDTDADAARRLQRVISYCRADTNCLWMNYWEGKGTNGNWSLIGRPGQTVMKAAMAS